MWRPIAFGKKPKLNKPFLIVGLPGIGSVGKIAVDFLIDELKAKKIFSFESTEIPSFAFVNEKNLVELPTIELYLKKRNGKGAQDLLLLAGDYQPINEASCYEFSQKLLDVCVELGCEELVALGGIGLKNIPKKPKVYCTAVEEEVVKSFAKAKASPRLYGVVGPIVGTTGLIVGLAGKRKLKAAALLAETYAHPAYLGVMGARELLKTLNKKYNLGISLEHFDEEIARLEKEFADIPPPSRLREPTTSSKGETSYIG
ncbi:MAG: PAC2 family protein [Candidatus Woesearchaeota archaeon]